MARKKDQAADGASPKKVLEKRYPPNKLYSFAKVAECSAVQVEQEKLTEIAGLLWFGEGLSEEQKHAKILKAIDLFESIEPDDGIEAMLAAQMVGTHHAAIECLRRAMLPGQTFDGRNAALTHAQRLMSLYAKQLAALDKHRGKGQQKVTVEHVNVAAGGQAIVGNVDTSAASGPKRRKVAPPQIEHAEPQSNAIDELSTPRKAGSRARRG
ncbi:hypothetical protein [Novosphingobium album (ex Liu et al. 2023)]|uniref:Terminase n=1 Tax=Novosphingobium album (ex Liu et al. 2023) TaxID=3031130 RepID=A0ABT5WT51_9SPHN|nr:hypothetical protein [Novosphingobium album (ex Liu et al. 2023)]MDE8652542.1 hypothetical protein [Novosphingobium album (ex Liu et al. 2023)]